MNDVNYSPAVVKGFITDDKQAKAMVDCANSMGSHLKENSVKSHQIRNAFGTMKKLQMEGWDEKGSTLRHLQLLKPKLAYAAARQESDSKKAMERMAIILGSAIDAVQDEEQFERFCQFFEAILAYHRAYGGK